MSCFNKGFQVSTLLLSLTLGACNYGNDDKPAVSVDSITATDLNYASNGIITITGQNLGQEKITASAGCKTFVELTTDVYKSSEKRSFTCAVPASTTPLTDQTLDITITATRMDGTVLKVETLKAGYAAITIDKIEATTPITYNASATFKFTGTNLDKGLILASTTCKNVVEVAGGTATERSYTCTVPSSNQTIDIAANRTGGGATLKSTTFPVSYAASNIQVTDLAVDIPVNRYGSLANIAVTGDNLDNTVTIDSCSNAITTTTTQRIYSCKILAAADATQLVFNAKRADGYILKTVTMPLPPKPQVLIKTDLGDIMVELEPTKTPITVNNFLAYVNDNFYTSTIFHRIIKGDGILQGGGFSDKTTQKTATYAAITLESKTGISNVRGTIAMARTNVLNSATSQFFFNTIDKSSRYDYKTSDNGNTSYAAFGTIINSTGLSVMDSLSNVAVDANGLPNTNLYIQSMIQMQ